jgi:hypothetical protein
MTGMRNIERLARMPRDPRRTTPVYDRPDHIGGVTEMVGDPLKAALDEYHAALSRREHGGVAADRLVKAIEAHYGQSFDQYRARRSVSLEALEGMMP